MRKIAILMIAVLSLIRPAASLAADVDPGRVDQIAAMLSDETFAFGPKISDRAAWAELDRKPMIHALVARAEKLLADPIPPVPDELFLEFSKTGNRVNYEKVYFDRTGRITPLVVAECIEHRGRFIPAIEELVSALCAQKTWMLPAHDANLRNYRGEAKDIDLFSSELACDLATAAWLLGDSLNADTRKAIDENVCGRVLDRFREMVTGKRKPDWWITGKNNWNAVCVANVLGAALADLPDRHDRAIFAAAAEQDSLNYLDGFDADGYCVEGLGYWNYGFGNYTRLSELLFETTSGRVDCFSRDKVRAIAEFPGKLMITDGVYPAYGDAHLDAEPWPLLVDFVDRRFGLAWAGAPISGDLSNSPGGNLSETLMFAGKNSAGDKPVVAGKALALRDWFGDAQVLTCRPGVAGEDALAVSIKGGRNGVSHGHDDLGSFVLVVGKTQVLVDPGSEVYTARTFSKDRYQSKVINSFGHNVPLVAGQLQQSTTSAQVKILDRQFGDSVDMLAMDLASAYAVPELTELHRTFVYDRSGGGSLTIRDECRFDSPRSFGIQFITFGIWEQVSPTRIRVWQGSEAVTIDFDAGGQALNFSSQTIDEDLPGKEKPTHISVDLQKPSADVSLKSVIRVDHGR
jgi:hypothetical protein